MRQFIEFIGDPDEGEARLEIGVYAQRIENDLLDELKNLGFLFTGIDADSLRAEARGNYKDIWSLVGKLRELGFYWNEEVKELEEKGELATRKELEHASG